MKQNKYYIYHASRIEMDWLFELAGHYYEDTRKKQAAEKYEEELNILQNVTEKR